MRLAHISDLHISVLYKRDNIYKTQKLLEEILKQNIDHIIITGDISDNAEWKEFLIFRNILKNFGLLDTKKTTIIIGNHDIFGGVQTAEDVINFPAKCKGINYSEAVTRFMSYFSELFEDVKTLDKTSQFPFIKTIDNYSILGINSIDKYSTLRNPFASNGIVMDEHIKLLKNEFSKEEYKNKIIIPAVHHHFYKSGEDTVSSSNKLWNNIEKYTMKLRKKKRLINFFNENNVKIVLHGHSHDMKTYVRKGINFVNAGASIDNKTNNAFFYLIELKEHILVTKKKFLTSPRQFNKELSAKEIIKLAV